MATRSIVAYMDQDSQQFISTYIHYDGYIAGGVGEMLKKMYNTDERAKAVVSAGYISSLSEDLAESITESANNDAPIISPVFEADAGQEYEYFWCDDAWYYRMPHSRSPEQLFIL